MSLPPKIQEVLEDIEMVGENGRQMYLIDYSNRFESVPESVATEPFNEKYHVKECESDAYVFPNPQPDGTLNFEFAVLNPQGVSARAFSKIIKEALDGQPLEVINAVPNSVVTDLFGKRLSMGRGLGLQGILNMIKYFAREHYQDQN